MESQTCVNLKKAAEMVKDLPTNLQAKAFELAFNDLNKLTLDTIETESKTVSIEPESIQDFYAKMEAATEINPETLKEFYKREGDGVEVIGHFKKGKAADNQRQLAYLYLLASRFGFNKEWVPASDLARIINKHAQNDGHISVNLSRAKRGHILQSGTRKGMSYSLGRNGIIRAIELINGEI